MKGLAFLLLILVSTGWCLKESMMGSPKSEGVEYALGCYYVRVEEKSHVRWVMVAARAIARTVPTQCYRWWALMRFLSESGKLKVKVCLDEALWTEGLALNFFRPLVYTETIDRASASAACRALTSKFSATHHIDGVDGVDGVDESGYEQTEESKT